MIEKKFNGNTQSAVHQARRVSTCSSSGFRLKILNPNRFTVCDQQVSSYRVLHYRVLYRILHRVKVCLKSHQSRIICNQISEIQYKICLVCSERLLKVCRKFFFRNFSTSRNFRTPFRHSVSILSRHMIVGLIQKLYNSNQKEPIVSFHLIETFQ